jgi:hypothetical protein
VVFSAFNILFIKIYLKLKKKTCNCWQIREYLHGHVASMSHAMHSHNEMHIISLELHYIKLFHILKKKLIPFATKETNLLMIFSRGIPP